MSMPHLTKFAVILALCLAASACAPCPKAVVYPVITSREPTEGVMPLDPLGECDRWLLNQREGARPKGCVIDERD